MLCRPNRRLSRRLLSGCALAALSGAVLASPGCNDKKKETKVELPAKYVALPPRKVPDFMKDTILEKCDLINTEPFLVSGYGVVVNLANTGGTQAPNAVREYIVKEMDKHKFGSSLSWTRTPEPIEVLRDPRVAIVEVDGYLPPGVRKGQFFDVQVSALPDSDTTSLAQGDLFQTDLRIFGANPNDPGGAVNVFARCQGPVFVNPAYALSQTLDDPAARRSLRMGIIMNGGRSMEDRPLGLRLRSPSLRMSKYIEGRIDQRLQEIKPDTIASAQDEGVVHIYVPVNLNGDWEHFAGLVQHLYLNTSPEFAATRAAQLADAAVKPDAPLMDISYCWEGLGKFGLTVIRERNLMMSDDQDVAYSAARAAAYLGDMTAPAALVKIATTKGHKFQVNAVQILSTLPNSPAINELIRPLLNSEETLVRLAAYRMLAQNKDGSIFSTVLPSGFILDIVKSDGPPVIYATRRGDPRLAIIGNRTNIEMPVVFSSMNGRLTISSDFNNRTVTMFYRPPIPTRGPRNEQQAEQVAPIRVTSKPDIAEIVARLSGEGFDDVRQGRGFDFNYGEILSILTQMTDSRQVVATANGVKTPASLMLQELPQVKDEILNAPVIRDQGRPQSEDERRMGMAK